MRQIEAATEAGADMVKFQFWSDADALANRRHVPDHYREVYRRYQMPKTWLPALAQRCEQVGMPMAVTCYLPCDVPTIEPFTAAWKVASFEAGAMDLRDAIGQAAHKPLYLSVGMLDEVETAKAIGQWGRVAHGFRVLLCVSAYPAPLDACNFRRMIGFDVDAPDFDGFSDHTANVLTGAFAVCAGAGVVEFHLRLDSTPESNPDYACALDPKQAVEYCRLIRLAEVMMGDGVKRLMPAEETMARYRTVTT